MKSIVIKLDPSRMTNPDLDIRYVLPDLIAARTEGRVSDDGYDYAADSTSLLLFLRSDNPKSDSELIIDILTRETILGSDLKDAAIVAIRSEDQWTVVYPAGFTGEFRT